MTSAAAGASLFISPGAEGLTARAGADGIGILDAESPAHQAVDIVDVGAFEVLGARAIQIHAHTAGLEHVIAIFSRVFKGHPILKTGTAAARNKDTQAVAGEVLFGENLLQFFCRER